MSPSVLHQQCVTRWLDATSPSIVCAGRRRLVLTGLFAAAGYRHRDTSCHEAHVFPAARSPKVGWLRIDTRRQLYVSPLAVCATAFHLACPVGKAVLLTGQHFPSPPTSTTPPLQVYDVTSYLDDHPGGAESILLNTGVDASEEFNSIHSQVGGRPMPYTGASPGVLPTHIGVHAPVC
jgi:hypothetical protein